MKKPPSTPKVKPIQDGVPKKPPYQLPEKDIAEIKKNIERLYGEHLKKKSGE